MFCALKPCVSISHRFIIRPIASTLVGWIDDTSDMPAAAQYKSCLTTGKLCNSPRRFPWNDMILLCTHCVNVLVNLAQIYWHAFQDNFIGLNKIVLQVSITQIEGVCISGHARSIVIPVEQVEGRRLFA